MLEEARRQAPNATYVQGDALALPFEDGSFDRVFTAHFYGHLEGDDRERFLAEARRLAPELVVVDSALREDVEPEERQERVLNDGSRWEVYKRYFEPVGAGARARRRRDGLRRSLVRRRPLLTRRRTRYRSLASLQRDNRVCRACVEAGFPLESLPIVQPYDGQRAYVFGQAPGVVEGEERRPWRGRAGRTLRRWLELDEDEFYATFYCASVTRCYPGRASSGRGDRTPTPASRSSAPSGESGSCV